MDEADTLTTAPLVNERRDERRRRALLSGRLIYGPGEMTTDCTIQNISRSGARVRVTATETLEAPVYLIDMRHGLAFQADTRWRREDRAGLAFTGYYDLQDPASDAPKLLRALWIERTR